MSSNKYEGCLIPIITGVLIIIFLLISWGPSGLKNKYSAWMASSYGSDWLIVQYNTNGGIISTWEINGAVNNETNSDGIFFTTENGVVHLSGHYVYVQNPKEEIKTKLLKGS